MTAATDQNGRRLAKRMRKEQDGTWGANVWFGHHSATTLRRYFYRTAREAKDANISDDENVVRIGRYEN